MKKKNETLHTKDSIKDASGTVNPHYITKSFHYGGRKYKVYGKTLEEAIRKRLELETRLKNEEVARNTITVEKWLKTALSAYKPNVSDDYMYQMQKRIDKHILPEIGHKLIQEVTPLDCQSILNSQSDMSASHIEKVKQELFFIFDTARKNKLINSNPCEDLELPSGSRGTRRAITPTERKHFLKVADSDDRYILFLLMLFCGCRSAEAMRVTYSDIIDLAGIEFIHIRGTKSDAADRMVPLAPEIKYRLIPGGRGTIAKTVSGDAYTKGSYRRAVDHLKRDMNISMGCNVFRNQLVPPLPLAEDFTPYYLRHTFCTDLKKKGVDLRYAKYLMGHSDIKVTANIYDHADDEAILQAAAQMGYAPK